MDKKWKPVHRPGGIYCSPRCGCDCLKADFDAAHSAAKKLAARMGKGWKPIVWENCGWHWRIGKGNLGGAASVHNFTFEITTDHSRFVKIKPRFTVWFQGSKQIILSGKTPELALKKVKKAVRGLIADLRAELAQA